MAASSDEVERLDEKRETLFEMMDMFRGVPVKDRKWRFRTYKRCFVAEEAVSWVAKRQTGKGDVSSEDRNRASMLLESLRSDGYVEHVVDKKKEFQDSYLFYQYTGKAKEALSQRRRSLNASVKIENLVDVLNAVTDPVSGVLIKDRKWRLKTYKQCFVASELVDWMMNNLRMRTRGEAIELANRFVANGSIRHVVQAQPVRDEYLFFRVTNKELVDDEQKLPVAPDAFETIKVLGVGGFGKVVLARKKDTGKMYAIKAMKKSSMVSDRELRNLQSELEILKNDHAFLVHLYWSFQTDADIYLVLDYLPGGDLFFHLQQYPQGFPPAVATFFVAETLLALEYLHACGVIYRDLKLESMFFFFFFPQKQAQERLR
jgi:Protein kinase domain/Domain found in Dishevelled, Egl-10, and Pleckstrin (DEP)